jgi:hypothetical protein
VASPAVRRPWHRPTIPAIAGIRGGNGAAGARRLPWHRADRDSLHWGHFDIAVPRFLEDELVILLLRRVIVTKVAFGFAWPIVPMRPVESEALLSAIAQNFSTSRR